MISVILTGDHDPVFKVTRNTMKIHVHKNGPVCILSLELSLHSVFGIESAFCLWN